MSTSSKIRGISAIIATVYVMAAAVAHAAQASIPMLTTWGF